MSLDNSHFDAFKIKADLILSGPIMLPKAKYEQFIRGELPDLSTEGILQRKTYPFHEFGCEFQALSDKVVDEIQLNIASLVVREQVEGYLDNLDVYIVSKMASLDVKVDVKDLYEKKILKVPITETGLTDIKKEHLKLLEAYFGYLSSCYQDLRKIKAAMDYQRYLRGLANTGLQHLGGLTFKTGLVRKVDPVLIIDTQQILALYKLFYNEIFSEISVGDFIACFDSANIPKNLPKYYVQDDFVAMLSEIDKINGARHTVNDKIAWQNFGIKNYRILKSKLSESDFQRKISRQTLAILKPDVKFN